MAYDPNLPAHGTPIVSAELRSQLNGLNDSINSVASQMNAIPTSDGMRDVITDNSANNIDALQPLTLTISNPPTQAQVQAILAKLNEAINGLRHV